MTLRVKRRLHETVRIGPDVVVTVAAIGRDSVRLDIDAPPDYKIWRNALRVRRLSAEPVLGCVTLHVEQSCLQGELNPHG